MKTAKEILGAKSYLDIFSKDDAVAKKEYREYCKLYHPDSDNSEQAAKLFDIINTLYNNKHIKLKGNGLKEDVVTFKNKETGKGFQLTNPTIFNNGLAMVYHTSTKIAIVYDKSYKKFYNNYINQVKNLRYVDDKMEAEFKRYFPKIITNFETEDGNFCILLDKTNEVLNLGIIVREYFKKGESFPEKQAAWILNRLYNIACYFNFNKKVFNGFTLDNLWVSPEMHTVLPLTGFEYTTNQGEQMIGCPKDVYKILPIKVKDSKQSDIITDLESIKNIGRLLYKEHKELKAIHKFLDDGVSNNEPINEWELYGEAIKKEFGKRTFIKWENVPYTN